MILMTLYLLVVNKIENKIYKSSLKLKLTILILMKSLMIKTIQIKNNSNQLLTGHLMIKTVTIKNTLFKNTKLIKKIHEIKPIEKAIVMKP